SCSVLNESRNLKSIHLGDEDSIVDQLLIELKFALPSLDGTTDVTSLEIIQQAIFYIHELSLTLDDDVSVTSGQGIIQHRCQQV
uniref:BHLH domain-containing protein n=1 Tax=Ciona savignyi TaxID=51511 RepID=H2Z345_CIOSA